MIALPSRNRSRYCILIVLALACLLTACGTRAAVLPDPAPNTIRQQQDADGLTITMDTAEAPRPNEYQQFLVTLTDGRGQPVDDADVYLDLRCLALCGPNTPIADPVGSGAYLAQTAYTMAGDWKIIVNATVGDTDHQAVFATYVNE